MPDMENLTDQLRIDMAEIGINAKGKSADFWEGFRAGKSRARWEVVIIFAVICFSIVVIDHYYT